MCSMKTDAMKSSDITKTGTGPLKIKVQFHFLIRIFLLISYLCNKKVKKVSLMILTV